MVTTQPRRLRSSSATLLPFNPHGHELRGFADASSTNSSLYDMDPLDAEMTTYFFVKAPHALEVSGSTQAFVKGQDVESGIRNIYIWSRPSVPMYVEVGFPRSRNEVFKALQDPTIDQLFDRLNGWAERTDEDWERNDSDPMTVEAISVARRLLQVLSATALGWYLYFGTQLHVELLASRDGGVDIILSTLRRELEFAIHPDGEIHLLIDCVGEPDLNRRYIERGHVSIQEIVNEIPTLLA